MLVLSRKKSERIVIEGGIIIQVLEIRRDKVRLGIEAPGDVLIYREEILKRKAGEFVAEKMQLQEAGAA